ncbi:MAG: sulfite exporter TauE/SafE family protein [Alphaproteobacteria bacterium]
MSSPATHLFHVTGMHCKACVMLIESDLGDAPGVERAKASLRLHQIEVTGDFHGHERAELVHSLNAYIEKHGYRLFLEKQKKHIAWREVAIAAPLAAGFLGLFILLQKSGIMNLAGMENVNYASAFIIGIIASLSTCMAVVGGLTLSISANFAKTGDKIAPQLLFHAARLAAFFALGGIIGVIGAEFPLGLTGMMVLNIMTALVMLILGVNLLDVMPWADKFQPALPRFITGHLLEWKQINHTLTPALLGAATFFLPCGFTQSMQIYALSTGHFWAGAAIMLSFALGTLPVLGLLSFASLGIHGKKMSGIFFKTAGLVVIGFAAYNLANALAVAGLIKPIRI